MAAPVSFSRWFAGDSLPTDASGEKFGYRRLATEVIEFAAFSDFVLEHRFGEFQCEYHRLPRINAEYRSLFVINESFEPNWAAPVVAIRLWCADRYVNRRFAICTMSQKLKTQVSDWRQDGPS